MSYQPPPQGSSGDNTPEEQAQGNAPVGPGPDPSPTINMGGAAGAQPPQPPQGGYTPPPPPAYGSSQGGYTPPPPPQGDLTPPPPQGGYTPPPPQGGYTPAPPQGGGGYSPPPPPTGGGGGGGYGGTPPPTPPSGPGGMGSFSQGDLQSLVQSWINAVTKPNVATFEGELRNATWMKVIIGVAAVAIVSFIVNLLFASLVGNALNPLFDQLENQFRSQGKAVDLGPYRNFSGGSGPFGALIGPFITFFLGSGWLYLMAKVFGGQDSNFLTHSYVLSISYAPLRIIAAIVGLIPCVGPLIILYQLYLSGLALQASHRMAPGRAQMAVWIPFVVLLLLSCICLILVIFVFAAAAVGSGQ